jgi:hypothetical protein
MDAAFLNVMLTVLEAIPLFANDFFWHEVHGGQQVQSGSGLSSLGRYPKIVCRSTKFRTNGHEIGMMASISRGRAER